MAFRGCFKFDSPFRGPATFRVKRDDVPEAACLPAAARFVNFEGVPPRP